MPSHFGYTPPKPLPELHWSDNARERHSTRYRAFTYGERLIFIQGEPMGCLGGVEPPSATRREKNHKAPYCRITYAIGIYHRLPSRNKRNDSFFIEVSPLWERLIFSNRHEEQMLCNQQAPFLLLYAYQALWPREYALRRNNEEHRLCA